MLDAETAHRGHAIIEQVIAELKDGPLAHLPSGTFTANAAWLVLATIAFNLTRAAGSLALHARARLATLRTQLINVPARLARSADRVFFDRALQLHPARSGSPECAGARQRSTRPGAWPLDRLGRSLLHLIDVLHDALPGRAIDGRGASCRLHRSRTSRAQGGTSTSDDPGATTSHDGWVKAAP